MTLFIGGPLDGQRRAIFGGNQPRYYCVRQTGFVHVPTHDMALRPVPVERFAYQRHELGGIDVFAIEGMPAAEVIRELIRGYKSCRGDKP